MSPILAIKAANIALPLIGEVAKGAGKALSALSGTGKAEDAGKIKAKKTADDFETVFLEQTFDRLLSSEGTEGPLGENGIGGDVWRSQLSKEYAKTVQQSGGIGISKDVYSAILKLQGGGA